MGATTTIDRTGCAARRHGNDNAYAHGCRCPDARTAWARYSYNLRHGLHQPRRVNATPTTQRIRILAGIGYDWRTLARLLNTAPRTITELAHGDRTYVYRTTAQRIRDLYQQLIREPIPHGYPANRAINNAIRKGWGLIDLEVVHRALAGHRPTLTPLEKRAVIYTGAAHGLPTTTIAAAARVNGGTVTKALAA